MSGRFTSCRGITSTRHERRRRVERSSAAADLGPRAAVRRGFGGEAVGSGRGTGVAVAASGSKEETGARGKVDSV